MFRKNMLGFAHHAILGMLVIGVISIAGIKVLTGTHALTETTYTNGRIFARKYTINPNGSGFKELSVPGDFDGHYANMSADGTQIAYFAKSTSPVKVKVGTISNGAITNTRTIGNTNYDSPVGPLYWSPDGSKLAAVVDDPYDEGGIWIGRTNGTGSHLVKNTDNGTNYLGITAIGWL